jgi:hypothetical protein
MSTRKTKKAPKTYARTCPGCGRNFRAKRQWQRFCSGPCRYQAWYRHEQDRRAAAAGFKERLEASERRIARIEKTIGLKGAPATPAS